MPPQKKEDKYMYWTLELATKLEDAPWPATKKELIDFALRSGAISPGVSLDGKIKFGEKFAIGLLTDFAFSPKDFSKNSLILALSS